MGDTALIEVTETPRQLSARRAASRENAQAELRQHNAERKTVRSKLAINTSEGLAAMAVLEQVCGKVEYACNIKVELDKIRASDGAAFTAVPRSLTPRTGRVVGAPKAESRVAALTKNPDYEEVAKQRSVARKAQTPRVVDCGIRLMAEPVSYRAITSHKFRSSSQYAPLFSASSVNAPPPTMEPPADNPRKHVSAQREARMKAMIVQPDAAAKRAAEGAKPVAVKPTMKVAKDFVPRVASIVRERK